MRLQVLYLWLFLFCLAGCNAIGRMFVPEPTLADKVTHVASEVSRYGDGLGMLSWVGGIATLTGIAALVITGGRMGMRAIVIGVCLCVLNFVVATYATWILLPVVIATGMVSIAWGYVTYKQVLKDKECRV